jgi:hypothetical protein
MRIALFALALGVGLGLLNHVAVISGMVAPPEGYEPAYVIRNLDVPQYLTWAALAKDHWLLPNYHAPWATEPALFQPLLQVVGKSGLPRLAAYYLLQGLLYWLAAYALIQGDLTFCRTRREMVYAAIAMVGALPLKLVGWAVAKWVGASQVVQLTLVYGLIEYTYETADGLLRGGLSNSFTLTFGTAVTVGGFTLLARYLRSGDRRYFHGLVGTALVGALFHPFEVFLLVGGAAWPLRRAGKWREVIPVGMAGALGLLPYLVQSVRSAWVRDASDFAQWHMSTPVWVLLAFGLPAILICWLLAMRTPGEGAEDDVLRSWFAATCLLPLVPAIPVAIHLFDGFAYCLGFLLVRLARRDKLFQRFRTPARRAAWVWAASSAAVLGTVYVQIWQDGRQVDPLIGRSAVVAKQERAMLEWMGANLPRERVVLAPEEMAPWVAAIPMMAMGSHDVFSISFDAQREAAKRFYAGDRTVAEEYGVNFVLVEHPLEVGELRHQEGKLRLYELMDQPPRAYASAGTRRNGFRRWVFAMLGAN